jgi:hypothetical protein
LEKSVAYGDARAQAQSWMLTRGWQIYGLIDPDEVPGRWQLSAGGATSR